MVNQNAGYIPRYRRKPSLHLDPLTIAFSQNSVSFSFANGTLLSTTVAKLIRGTLKVEEFPMIRVFNYRDTWYTLDNRRLHVFKEARKKAIFETIPVLVIPEAEIPYHELQTKLTTVNLGTQVEVRGVTHRTVEQKLCHYCRCRFPNVGWLSCHYQEEHLDEYKVEMTADYATIDQFLLSRNFNLDQTIQVTIDRLRRTSYLEEQKIPAEDTLQTAFQRKDRPTAHCPDLVSIPATTIERGEDELSSEIRSRVNSGASNKAAQKRPVRFGMKKKGKRRMFWQKDAESSTKSDQRWTELFNIVLHHADDNYPFA